MLKNLNQAIRRSNLPPDHANRLEMWASGQRRANTVRPKRETPLRGRLSSILILVGAVSALIGGAMIGIGRATGSKVLADVGVIPLWLASGLLLVTVVVWPFTLGLRWLTTVTEKLTPFWYYSDGSILAVYSGHGAKEPIKSFAIDSLKSLKWVVEGRDGPTPVAPHPTLSLEVETTDGSTWNHKRQLVVSCQETERFFTDLSCFIKPQRTKCIKSWYDRKRQ